MVTSSGETGTTSPANDSSQRVNGSTRRTWKRRFVGAPGTASPRRLAATVGPLEPRKSTTASMLPASPSSHACREAECARRSKPAGISKSGVSGWCLVHLGGADAAHPEVLYRSRRVLAGREVPVRAEEEEAVRRHHARLLHVGAEGVVLDGDVLPAAERVVEFLQDLRGRRSGDAEVDDGRFLHRNVHRQVEGQLPHGRAGEVRECGISQLLRPAAPPRRRRSAHRPRTTAPAGSDSRSDRPFRARCGARPG